MKLIYLVYLKNTLKNNYLMSKTKKDYLNDLVKISFEIDKKTTLW